MDKSIESTKWIGTEKTKFKSQVYSSIDEYFQDIDRVKRNEDYTCVGGKYWPRSKEERDRILIDKIKASSRLELHSEANGTELLLELS